MREVGNTQVGSEGRLQTMLAEPDELPAVEPGLPAIPRPPGARGRKKQAPVALVLLGLAVCLTVGFVVSLWAFGYQLEIGDYQISF